MSFSRATRFVYKEPEITVSPAEYNVPTSLGDIFTFCSKFQASPRKYSEGSAGSKRLGCKCKISLSNSSTTGNSLNYNERNTRRSLPSCSIPSKQIINLSNSKEIAKRRSFFGNSISNNNSFKERITPLTKRIDNNRKYDCTCQSKFKDAPFWVSEEFIDDDYYSYTSSEPLTSWNTGNIHLNDFTNFNRRNFEQGILQRVENISRYVDTLNSSFNEFKEVMLLNQCHNRSEITIRHTIDLTGLYEPQLSNKMENLIHSTIDNYKRQPLSTQNFLNEDANFKNRDTESSNREICDDQIEELPDNDASILNREILNLTDDDKTLEFDISINSDIELNEFDDIFICDFENFDNEDIYNALSMQLQINHKELDELEEDKTELMTKSDNTYKEIIKQTEALRELHREFADLRSRLN
ncbi:unnamed protein product [Diabrotica balteata]|uniref:Uncharacterized protein n=1 Tax=Diabrotica balteata TaxID=107213 RepID=A0A9N9XGY1_DIABA|nr:unnamed protein product [Diabrotica balteata]